MITFKYYVVCWLEMGYSGETLIASVLEKQQQQQQLILVNVSRKKQQTTYEMFSS